ERVDPNTLPIRIRGVYVWLKYLEENWDELYHLATTWPRTLLQPDFIPPEIVMKKYWDFDIDDSVYRSKMWSILFPDICIPYDTRSRIAIKSFLGHTSMTYADMLRGIRSISIKMLKSENLSIS